MTAISVAIRSTAAPMLSPTVVDDFGDTLTVGSLIRVLSQGGHPVTYRLEGLDGAVPLVRRVNPWAPHATGSLLRCQPGDLGLRVVQ